MGTSIAGRRLLADGRCPAIAVRRQALPAALRWLAPFLLAAALYASPWRPALAAPALNEAAPAFFAQLLDGSVVDTASTRGKVVLLHFWATWCQPCREELPALEQYYRAHHRDGLEVVAISIEDADALAKVKSFTKDYSFPVAMIEASQVEAYGRVNFLPLSFLIDRHGIVRKSAWTGTEKITAASLDKFVSALLEEPSQRIAANDR